MNDLRVTIGGFFLAAGAIVGITGVTADYRAPLEPGSVNIYCGAAMLVFGAIMLWLGVRKKGGDAR